MKFLMPAIQNARIKKMVEGGDVPSILDYSMGDARYKHVGFKLVVVKSNKDPGKKMAFATNLNVTPENSQSMCNDYSKRWGIETSYRVTGEYRARTTSKNYVVRMFYFLFSVCLYNLWFLANVVINTLITEHLSEKPLITARVFGVVLNTDFSGGGWGRRETRSLVPIHNLVQL